MQTGSEQWQENQKKKEYLNGYLKAKNRERRILEQIQQLRTDEMFPAMQYDDMPHGTNITDLSDYAAKLDELLEELKNERLEAIEQYTKIYREIKAVEDEREREILIYRYLQGEKWEMIYVIMGLKGMQTHRIHSNALKNFKMI